MSTDANGVGSRLPELIARHRPGWALDRPFYADPAIFQVELEKIFLPAWLYAGHVSRIPRRGDYFLFDIADESIIVIRGEDGQVHGLVNVCRHRGSRVCTEPAGCAPSLVCPYHQWVYRPDGSLQSARLMPADFDKSQFGLRRAHVRVAEGLIFLCLADEPPDLGPVLADIVPHLEPYELARTKICKSEDFELPANWKVLSENFRECYHCGGNHPELCRLMPHIALESPRALEEFEGRAAEAHARWQRLGLATRNVPVGPNQRHHVIRFPFKQGFVTQTMDGQPTAPLLGRLPDAEAGVVAGSILPSFWFEVSVDYAVLMRLLPAGPRITRIQADWLVREDAVAGVDYDADTVARFWRLTLEQDWKLCANTQRGVESRYYVPGPFAPGITAGSSLGERGPRAFVEWYLKQMAE